MAAISDDLTGGFDAAYRAHYGMLHRRARRFLPDGEAEDAVQETFLRAWHRFGRKGPEVPWLLTVLRNLAIDRSRTKRAEPVGEAASLDAATADVTSEAVISLDERRAVRRAMTELTGAQAEALRLREWEGRSHAEIAERMRTSVEAVESLLARGRQRLRNTSSLLKVGAQLVVIGLLAAGAVLLGTKGLPGGLPDTGAEQAAPEAVATPDTTRYGVVPPVILGNDGAAFAGSSAGAPSLVSRGFPAPGGSGSSKIPKERPGPKGEAPPEIPEPAQDVVNTVEEQIPPVPPPP